MTDNRTAQWLVLAAVAAILAVGVTSLPVVPGQSAPVTAATPVDDIRLSWNWKKDVTGRMFAVFGTVQNTGLNHYAHVLLDFRTEDADGRVVGRHTFRIGNVPPGGQKAFRQDVPRTGREEMGYLEVRSRVP